MARLLRNGKEVRPGDFLADLGATRLSIGPRVGNPQTDTVQVRIIGREKSKLLPGRPPIIAFARNLTGDAGNPNQQPGNEVFGMNNGYNGFYWGTRYIDIVPGTTQENLFQYSRRFQTGFPWTLECGFLRTVVGNTPLPATWMSDFGMTIWNETTDSLHLVVCKQGEQSWDEYAHFDVFGRRLTRWLWDNGPLTWGLNENHIYSWIRDDYSQYPETILRTQTDDRYEDHPARQYGLEWEDDRRPGGAPLVTGIARGRPVINPETGGLTFEQE